MSPSNKMNKNFKCEICEATFSYDRSKNHHIKTIHSEGKTLKSKSFKCEICVDTFSSNCSKNRHIKTFHGKGKTYKCNACNKIFGRKDSLRLHDENNHQERKQKCNFCGKDFARYESLNKHIKNIHDEEKVAITNVFLVENPPLHHKILGFISKHFMKDKETTNVILVVNRSLNQVL